MSSTRAAEMAKILENAYRAVNIALVNELKVVSDKVGLDIDEIIRAAASKPFGFMPFYPSPGLGGHCIPIRPLLFNLEGPGNTALAPSSPSWPVKSTAPCPTI